MEGQNNREWRIRGVGKKLREETKNIAENIGIGASDFVKQTVSEKVNSYPEHMKKPPRKD